MTNTLSVSLGTQQSYTSIYLDVVKSALKTDMRTSTVHIPFRFHVVLWVLLGQETGELHDGGVVAAADVPARRGLVLGYEHLGATEVIHVAYRHRVGDRLDAYQDVQLCLVA